MAVTTNYIDESERKFLLQSYVDSLGGLWSSDETLVVDSVVFQDAEFGSLKVSGSSSPYVKYNIWSTPATDVPSQYALTSVLQNNTHIEAFVWVRPTKNCTVNLSISATLAELDGSTYMLSTDPNDVIEGDVGSHRIAVGTADEPIWHLVRAVPLLIPDDDEIYSLGLTVSVTYDDVPAGEMNISRPVMYNNRDVFFNVFGFLVAQYMPVVFLENDYARYNKAEVTFPLIRLLDVITSTANDVNDKVDEITYTNSNTRFDENEPGTFSTLVNPQFADSATLEWLAQFRGRNLIVTYEPSTNGEPWELFKLDESLLDGTDVLSLTSAGTTTFSGAVEEFYKWQVNTAAYGHNSGTLAMMIEAIQLLLTGTKTINETVTATSIHFETKIGETFGGGDQSIGDESPYVIQILEPMRPLGMVITHELIA